MINIIVTLIIGGVSGWLAGQIMKSNQSIIINIVLGLVGGAVGKLLGSIVQIGPSGWIGDIIFSVIGACVLIWLYRLIFKK